MWSDIIKKWGKDFSPGDIIKIVGRVETFRNANQLLVEKARRVAEDEQPNFSYLIRSTEFNTTDLFNELVLGSGNAERPDKVLHLHPPFAMISPARWMARRIR